MSRFGLVEDNDVEIMIESSKKGLHKTMEGNMVSVGTKECRDDIMKRMDDMSYHRDDHDYGSDARSYFSGVLRVLRRKLRENDKLMSRNETLMTEKDAEAPEENEIVKESVNRRKDEEAANRMLKMAGLL